MGKFESGVWIIGLLAYFFLLFIIMSNVILAADEYGLSKEDVYVLGDNPFASTDDPDAQGYTGINFTQSQGYSIDTVYDTLGVLSGFGAGKVGLGVPVGYVWIFSFIFFYIPLFMLLWSIYMALPVLH